MPIKHTYEGYYTAAEAMKALGVTDGMFYNFIRNRDLEGTRLPGRKQNLYKKEDVDRMARELQAFIVQRKTYKTARFVKITTKEEMTEAMEISQALFGVGLDVLNERMELLAKNPDTYYILKDESGMIVGYTSIMPLKPGNLDKALGLTLPVKVEIEDIAEFKYGDHIDLYLTAIGVRPGFSNAEKHAYGAKLLSGLIEVIIDLGQRGVAIDSIAARSYTGDGIRLMRHAGFTEVPSLTPERRTFIIKIEESGIPFVMHYKSALEKALARGTAAPTPTPENSSPSKSKAASRSPRSPKA